MAHTMGYIIETDALVSMQYDKTLFVPATLPTWVPGVNEFASISMVDPYDYTTPDLVRVPVGGDYDYYFKTLHIPWFVTKFIISVTIDGVEGNGSFIYEGFNSFIKMRRVGSEIYCSAKMNKKRDERNAIITITHRSSDADFATVRVVQDPCDIRLNIISCLVDDGTTQTTVSVGSKTFDYVIDTLTDKTDCDKQSLAFTMDVSGVKNKYFVKSIKEYVELGPIDSTYRYMNGKFYRRAQKYVNGNFVTYYAEATVINNIAYELKNYDGAFSIEMLPGNVISFTSYGRVFMENNAIYQITLANYDDINETCEITIRYADNP
jgi:hypothetical protein